MRRVVSIVPSLTEAVAATARALLVGATDWCTHPGDLDVARVRGTKNPDVGRIVALRPDLVLANAEENRLPDLDALRAAGLAVYVTDIRTLDGAFASLRRMLAACGYPRDVQVARVRAPVRRPDQQGAGGGGDRLGERGDDADDTPHRSAHRDRTALIVDDHSRDATAPGRRAARRTP